MTVLNNTGPEPETLGPLPEAVTATGRSEDKIPGANWEVPGFTILPLGPPTNLTTPWGVLRACAFPPTDPAGPLFDTSIILFCDFDGEVEADGTAEVMEGTTEVIGSEVPFPPTGIALPPGPFRTYTILGP